MPIYDCKCEKCEKVSEILIRSEERDEVQVCPSCDEKAAKRLEVQLSNFQLVGRWFREGY